jgi:hypothetical protein
LEEAQLVRPPHVVLIGRGNELTVAAAQRLLEVRPEAEVAFVAAQSEARVSGGTGLEERPGGVAGGVVDRHHLQARVVLREERVELLRQEPLAVVGAERDGDERAFGHAVVAA